MIALAGGVVATATALWSYGSFHRNSPLFGAALGRLRGDAKRIALTFDDGPNPHATPAILDVLRAEQVPATFFLLGKHVERWPHLARRVAAEGHGVGNHGYHHRKLHLRGPAYVRLDLELGADAIVTASHARPTYFRA